MRKKRIHLILIVLGILLGLVISAVMILLDLGPQYYQTLSWILTVALLLWLGNKFIVRRLDKSFPWLQYGNQRFILQLLATIFYSLLVINTTYFTIKYLFTDDPPTVAQYLVMNVYGIFIILPVVSIYFGAHFLRSWRKSEIESAAYHRESMRSQLEALKNHLDPHFLFNNLNILSSLIDRDIELSKSYLEKFAEVYRVIIQSNVTEPIPLSKELDFVDAYMYLINIRFEEMIKLEVNVDQNLRNRVLPPLTLQMLVENAIKHNIIKENEPLYLKIESNGEDYLDVKNTLRPRPTSSKGSGTGLQNIKDRYGYFTDMEVKKVVTDDEFIVKVPIIELEEL